MAITQAGTYTRRIKFWRQRSEQLQRGTSDVARSWFRDTLRVLAMERDPF